MRKGKWVDKRMNSEEDNSSMCLRNQQNDDNAILEVILIGYEYQCLDGIVVYNYLSKMSIFPKLDMVLCFLCILLLTPMVAKVHQFDAKPDETRYRNMIRMENLAMINQLNAKYSQYYTAGPTQFTHLSSAEFAANFLGYNGISPSVDASGARIVKSQGDGQNSFTSKAGAVKKVAAVAASLGPFYVNLNGTNGTNGTYVTDVKNQGSCGSCWAFASIAEIESFYLWRHKLWLDLSEQQMVDCVPLLQTDNAGCGGGYLDSVSLYAVRYPVAQEAAYPYTAKEGTCTEAKFMTSPYKITSYVFISDCVTLTNTLLNLRAVGVCMVIDSKWNSYKSGVIPDCLSTKVGGHCVLLMGAKSDGSSTVSENYWLIRNSWGRSYGEYGFMKLYRNPADQTNGFCGMCKSAIYSQ